MIWGRIFGRRDVGEHASPVDDVWPTMDTGKIAPVARAAASDRDDDGRFASEHRRKVREKCREQCAKLRRDVPEALQ